MSEVAIQIFARPPVPGAVKTRLIPALGSEGAARLYERLLISTVEALAGEFGSSLSLWAASEVSHPFFTRIVRQYGLSVHSQVGDDLGERMAAALKFGLAGHDRVVLVGSDCPRMDASYVSQALQVLDSGVDCVIGPAEDGGYVLIGMRRFGADVFTDMPWGGDQVLDRTRERLRDAAWHWEELAPLWDVDRPEDLERWRRLHQMPA